MAKYNAVYNHLKDSTKTMYKKLTIGLMTYCLNFAWRSLSTDAGIMGNPNTKSCNHICTGSGYMHRMCITSKRKSKAVSVSIDKMTAPVISSRKIMTMSSTNVLGMVELI